MSSYNYERLLSITIDNALLHLWLSVVYANKHVPKQARNQILIRWFKPKVKDAKYKPIKKELKAMIQIARERSDFLEERLCELQKLSQNHRDNLNDMHKLHYLLEYLREEHDIQADLSEGVVEYRPNTLYVSQEILEQCFSNDKRQLKPIETMLSGVDLMRFQSLVHDFGYHKVEERNVALGGETSVFLHLAS